MTESPIDLCNRGNQFYRDKQYARAIACYSQALEATPTIKEAYLNRGNARILQDKPNFIEAIKDYTQAIRLDPGFPMPYYHRAMAFGTLAENGNFYLFKLANPDLRRFVQLSEPNKHAAARERQFRNLQAYDAAKLYFSSQEIVSSAERDAGVYLCDALDSIGQEDYCSALRNLDKAIEEDARLAEAYCARGFCHLSLKQLRNVEADLQKCVQFDLQGDPSKPSLRAKELFLLMGCFE